jgi:hypothetical protein
MNRAVGERLERTAVPAEQHDRGLAFATGLEPGAWYY